MSAKRPEHKEHREARIEKELRDSKYLGPKEQEAFDAEVNGKDVCFNCRFWNQFERPEFAHVTDINMTLFYCDGQCRRHAPRPIFETDAGDGERDRSVAWPETRYDEWCGEFQKGE